MEKDDKKIFAACEYENDSEFKDILVNPDQYVEILKGYQGFISPDCSIYRDMPLAAQINRLVRLIRLFLKTSATSFLKPMSYFALLRVKCDN